MPLDWANEIRFIYGIRSTLYSERDQKFEITKNILFSNHSTTGITITLSIVIE